LIRADRGEAQPKLGADDQQRIGDVVARVADKGQLAFLQGFDRILPQGHQVRQRLGGMVQIRQAVPDGHAGETREVFRGFLLKAAELDSVIEAPQHAGGVLQGFLFAHLGVGQEGDVAALVPAGGLKGAARAGGRFLKNQHDVLPAKQIAGDAGALFALQVTGQVQQKQDLLSGEILQGQQRAAFELHRHGGASYWFILIIP